MFFWTKKRAIEYDKREEKIRKIHLDTQMLKDEAAAALKKAQDEIERLVGDDVAQNIFYATGGDRRRHARR